MTTTERQLETAVQRIKELAVCLAYKNNPAKAAEIKVLLDIGGFENQDEMDRYVSLRASSFVLEVEGK